MANIARESDMTIGNPTLKTRAKSNRTAGLWPKKTNLLPDSVTFWPVAVAMSLDLSQFGLDLFAIRWR